MIKAKKNKKSDSVNVDMTGNWKMGIYSTRRTFWKSVQSQKSIMNQTHI